MPTTPSPLRYEIAHCSSWDNEHCPELLLIEEDEGNVPDDSHSPKQKGWQTEKEPVCPQDLIIHLSPGSAHIHELQLLSHHYKIATKVDIYIGVVKDPSCMMENDLLEAPPSPTSDSDESEKDNMVVEFTRLGYVTFDDNTKTGFRARELKTVPINSKGEYIRLVFRNCHQNKLNVHNQIGLEALNILGVPLSYETEMNKVKYTAQQHDDSSILSSSTWRSSISSSYSLNSYLMSPQVEIQSCVTALKAAEQEEGRDNYELREKLRAVRKELETLMSSVKVLEKAKINAVKDKHFERAAEIKPEIDAIMDQARDLIQQSGVQEFINSDNSKDDTVNQGAYQQNSILEDSMFDEAIEKWTTFDATSTALAGPSANISPSTPPSRLSEYSPIIANESAQLAYRNSLKIEPTLSESVMKKIRANSTFSIDPEFMSPDDKERYLNAVDFYGTEIVEDVQSLREDRRKNALQDIRELVSSACDCTKTGRRTKKSDLIRFFRLEKNSMDLSETVSSFVQATLYIIREAMLDSRTAIIDLAIVIWRLLIKFSDVETPDISMIYDSVERAFEALLPNTGHDKETIRTSATDLVLTLAYVYATPPYSVIPLFAGKPRKVIHNQSDIKSRILLVEKAIGELGLAEDGPGSIELDDLSAFVAAYGKHASKEVHEALIKLLTCAVSHVGFDVVQKYFDESLLKSLAESHVNDSRSVDSSKTASQKREPSRPQAPASDPKKKTITVKRTTTVKRQEPASLKGGKTAPITTKKATTTRTKSEMPTNRTKTTVKPATKAPNTKKKISSESSTCMFCDETNVKFNDETLIKHYYRECPALTLCTLCNELVEKLEMDTHKIRDCKKADKTLKTTKKKTVSAR